MVNHLWKEPTPDQQFEVGDQYLVALQVSRNQQGRRTSQATKTWYWEYHVITVTEDGWDNSEGDPWCSWSWEDVQYYINTKDLDPCAVKPETGNDSNTNPMASSASTT